MPLAGAQYRTCSPWSATASRNAPASAPGGGADSSAPASRASRLLSRHCPRRSRISTSARATAPAWASRKQTRYAGWVAASGRTSRSTAGAISPAASTDAPTNSGSSWSRRPRPRAMETPAAHSVADAVSTTPAASSHRPAPVMPVISTGLWSHRRQQSGSRKGSTGSSRAPAPSNPPAATSTTAARDDASSPITINAGRRRDQASPTVLTTAGPDVQPANSGTSQVAPDTATASPPTPSGRSKATVSRANAAATSNHSSHHAEPPYVVSGSRQVKGAVSASRPSPNGHTSRRNAL